MTHCRHLRTAVADRRGAVPRPTLPQLHADAAQIIARYPQPRSALLPLLHLVQSEEGYVTARRHRVLRRACST